MKYPVLLPNIFDYPFTYESDIKLKAGDYVKVPFGKKNIIGVIWDFFEEKNNKQFKLKSIIEKIEIEPLSKKTMNFLKWFSNYNIVPLGMCLKLHLINDENLKIKNDKDLLKYALSNEKESYQLSEEQDKAYKELSKNDTSFRVHLLQGTTGSGKTIVYFKAIEKIINIGLQALILLPEIGLTNEFEKKFKSYFGFEAAVWHSKVSPKKRKIIWNGLSAGKIKVVLGARSSLFLPFKKLGLITVDEEHDQSYKQDEGIIYNARDMAISRAKHENIPINLVTAVPSIETYENIKIKKFKKNKKIKNYILDLRNNPGGLLSQAIKISDYFLENGEIVSTKSKRKYENRKWFAKKGDIIDGKTMIILINYGSASASEIVAGALQDHKRAILVGESTYGKGSVQSIIPLENEGAIRLTVSKYYLPSGKSISRVGVNPDIVIAEGSDEFRINTDADNQLEFALKLLNG